MVKHAKTNRRQDPMNCLSVFDHFVGLLRKGLIRLWKSIVNKTFQRNIFFLHFMQKRTNSN